MFADLSLRASAHTGVAIRSLWQTNSFPSIIVELKVKLQKMRSGLTARSATSGLIFAIQLFRCFLRQVIVNGLSKVFMILQCKCTFKTVSGFTGKAGFQRGESVIHLLRLRYRFRRCHQANRAKQRVKSQILHILATKSGFLIALFVNIWYYGYYSGN